MSFEIKSQSVFDTKVEAYVNTINCVASMGAGIALEFKKRYPEMFEDYKIKCKSRSIHPGDCYVYRTHNGLYILGLAVKDDWKHWTTLEWIKMTLSSLKVKILELNIKSVNLPLLGGLNGRRGPYGKVSGMTPPPENDEIIKIINTDLESFSNQFGVEICLCIPDPNGQDKKTLDLSEFFGV